MKNIVTLHKFLRDITTVQQQLAKEEAKRYAEQSQQERRLPDYHLLFIKEA